MGNDDLISSDNYSPRKSDMTAFVLALHVNIMTTRYNLLAQIDDIIEHFSCYRASQNLMPTFSQAASIPPIDRISKTA